MKFDKTAKRRMVLNEARILGHAECRTKAKIALADEWVTRGRLKLGGTMSGGGRWYKPVPMAADEATLGLLVRFTENSLGSSEPSDLCHVTPERYNVGDVGVVAFEHPNQKGCPGWIYVEVDSKIGPARKLYVGCGPFMWEPVPFDDVGESALAKLQS